MDKNLSKANDQLFLIDCKKSNIKREIYNLYDLYLKDIRSKLLNYITEATYSIVGLSNNVVNIKDKKITLLVENDLKCIVNKILPFLTIEQLSTSVNINKDYLNKEIDYFQSNYELREEDFLLKELESINKFDTTNYYYEISMVNQSKPIDIDINYSISDIKFERSSISQRDLELNTFITLNKSEEEKSIYNLNHDSNQNIFIPIELREILEWIDIIDSSLNFYLKNLSIEINNIIQKKNIFKRFINKDLLYYIFENNLLLNNPLPFILLFDLSINQFINIKKDNYKNIPSKIYLLNIDSTELEFFNMNLNSLKNKILELKYNINSLIKKENYWSNKIKVSLNNSSFMSES